MSFHLSPPSCPKLLSESHDVSNAPSSSNGLNFTNRADYLEVQGSISSTSNEDAFSQSPFQDCNQF